MKYSKWSIIIAWDDTLEILHKDLPDTKEVKDEYIPIYNILDNKDHVFLYYPTGGDKEKGRIMLLDYLMDHAKIVESNVKKMIVNINKLKSSPTNQ